MKLSMHEAISSGSLSAVRPSFLILSSECLGSWDSLPVSVFILVKNILCDASIFPPSNSVHKDVLNKFDVQSVHDNIM